MSHHVASLPQLSTGLRGCKILKRLRYEGVDLRKGDTFRYLCKKFGWEDNDAAEPPTLYLVVPVKSVEDEKPYSALPSLSALEAE